uniref:Uncharacterized protein n=1 Tax=Anguilla anguilla TaxID=7936 RepID=A0A0E9PME5_ANGAN
MAKFPSMCFLLVYLQCDFNIRLIHYHNICRTLGFIYSFSFIIFK